MIKLKVGDKAPNFKMLTTNNLTVDLNYYQGKNLILYFYPKDDTPGCTIEAKNFNEAIVEFNKLNTIILGVSKDNVDSHNKFKTKLCLNFELAYDDTGKIYEDYDVLKEKSIFGKKFTAIDRTTFLINKESKIAAIWPKVSVTKHVDEVLKFLKTTR